MPAQIQLNQDILRHFRKRASETQFGVATAISITERGYQKIETTGRTSPDTAIKLSKHFDVSLEELRGEELVRFNSPYWFRASFEAFGLSEVGQIYSDDIYLLSRIKEKLAQNTFYVPSERNDIEITLSEVGGLYRIDVICPLGDLWMEFRRARLDPQQGLLWAMPSKYEKHWFEAELDKVLFSSSTNYIKYGKSVVPENKRSVIKLDLLLVGSSAPFKKTHLGWKFFESDDDALLFLRNYIEDFCPTSFYPSEYDYGLGFQLFPQVWPRRVSQPFVDGVVDIQLKKVWLEEDDQCGGFVPWHQKAKKRLSENTENIFKRVNDRTREQGEYINSRLPIVELNSEGV